MISKASQSESFLLFPRWNRCDKDDIRYYIVCRWFRPNDDISALFDFQLSLCLFDVRRTDKALPGASKHRSIRLFHLFSVSLSRRRNVSTKRLVNLFLTLVLGKLKSGLMATMKSFHVEPWAPLADVFPLFIYQRAHDFERSSKSFNNSEGSDELSPGLMICIRAPWTKPSGWVAFRQMEINDIAQVASSSPSACDVLIRND